MARPNHPVMKTLAVSALAASFLAYGCSRQEPETPQEAPPAATTVSNHALRSAAADFGAMVERSTGATWAEIDSLHARAMTSTSEARARLSPASAADLDRSLQALERARKEEDRAAFALASLDAKRNLIAAQDAATAQPPISAELLLTAGERYQVLTRAEPTDWAALTAAAAATDEQWRRTAPLLSPRSIPNTMQPSLTAMADAAKARDLFAAQHSAALQIAAARQVVKELGVAPPLSPAPNAMETAAQAKKP